MRKLLTLAALSIVAIPLQAKDKPAYEKGVLTANELFFLRLCREGQ